MTSYITPYQRKNSLGSTLALSPTWTLLDPFRWTDQLFRDNWDDLLRGSFGGLEFDEKSQSWSTELDLAGYKKEEVKVEVSEDGTLTVTAENEKRGKSVRSFYLSEAAADKIEAKLEHGVLSIAIPKKPEKAPKRIEIS